MKMLRHKITNMKDLFIFKNGDYREITTRNFDRADYSSNKITANLTSIVEKTKEIDKTETKLIKYNIDEVLSIYKGRVVKSKN